MKKINLSHLSAMLFLCTLVLFASCDDDPVTPPPNDTFSFSPASDNQSKVQEAMINMSDKDTIEFSEGTFNFTADLSIDAKNGIVIRGAGADKTTLSFDGQTAGAEGIKITGNDILLMNFKIENTPGDGIKVNNTDGITFWGISVEWTGTVSETNGAYGLYPVSSKNVLIDGCYVRGASDAGIYVGQSEHVIVRNSTAEENVAGIEIENTFYADVYNNTATRNTGGVLVFDLPNLPVKNGMECRVFNNSLVQNDHANFAPAGNIVGSVPPGTGIMILTSKKVEVFGNTITNNNVMGVGIVNYPVLTLLDPTVTLDDPLYDPYVAAVNIHDNVFSRTTTYPSDLNDIGTVLTDLFPAGDIGDIVYDGVMNADTTTHTEENRICIKNNTNMTFVNVNAPTIFTNPLFDVSVYDCTPAGLPEVTVDAPMP